MDVKVGVRFDESDGLAFTQGEDRTVSVRFYDQETLAPIDLTGAVVEANFPLAGGGSVKRSTGSIAILTSQVQVIADAMGRVSYPNHGLVTGDSFQLTTAGTLPSPLATLTDYLVKVIDVDTFGFTDTSGNEIELTAAGSGGFSMVPQDDDLVITTPTAGLVTMSLRDLVTSVINAGLCQSFQMEYTIAGKTRIAIIKELLDVSSQPVP